MCGKHSIFLHLSLLLHLAPIFILSVIVLYCNISAKVKFVSSLEGLFMQMSFNNKLNNKIESY